MKLIKKTLLILWQLPQEMLGALLLILNNKKIVKFKEYKTSRVFWLEGIRWGISLGSIIILSTDFHDEKTVKHEYGHSIQSLIFGPLYLLIIGIPSATMNRISLWLYLAGKPKFAQEYYNRWPENWADKLGGVQR